MLKPGVRLRSQVCTTEVMVVRASGQPVDLSCGGKPMVPPTDVSDGLVNAPSPGWDSGTLLGKRYHQEQLGLELLCIKTGAGSLAANGEKLEIKDAKPLPSSD